MIGTLWVSVPIIESDSSLASEIINLSNSDLTAKAYNIYTLFI